jgi:hypothetical protein
MTYAFPAWEFAADTHPSKLQLLHNKALRTTGKFPRCTPVQAPYIYDYIRKFCRQQSEIIENHENANFLDIRKCEGRHKI